MVRDEAMELAARPGKFQQPDDMKTVQETILELARSRAGFERRHWPTFPLRIELQMSLTVQPTDSAIAALQGRRETDSAQGG